MREVDRTSLMLDYLKFTLGSDPEMSQDLVEEWRGALAKVAGDGTLPGGWKPVVLAGRNGKESRYYLEVWGIQCSAVYALNAQKWLPRLVRCDSKMYLSLESVEEVKKEGKEMYDNPYRWNVHLHTGKERSKANGKTGGGIGYSIGSHKSDCRVTKYQGKGRPLGQETQLQGPVLERIKSAVIKDYRGVMFSSTDMWADIKYKVFCYGNDRLELALLHAVNQQERFSLTPTGEDYLDSRIESDRDREEY